MALARKYNQDKDHLQKELHVRIENDMELGANACIYRGTGWKATNLNKPKRMDSKNSCLQVPYKECWHKMRAQVAKSNTSRNPRRLFWGCPLWKISNCHYFRWLPEDASRAYMKLHGLEGVEIVDTADSLELLDNQSDMITTLVEENKMLKARQEEIKSQPTLVVENQRLRMRVEAMVKECQKTAVVCLVFGILLGFILGRM